MPTRSRQPQNRKLSWDKAYTRVLFRRYRLEGDEAARDELITMYLNLVKYLASRFRNRGEPIDDLIQVGTIGLIKAIDRF
jgi:RNA polymerase sigma-B factor